MIEIHYYRLALDKGIFGYMVPIKLEQQKDRGLGLDLDLGVPSTLGSGVSIITLFPQDLPHPDGHDSYIVG